MHRHDALGGRLYSPDKMVRMSNVTPVVIAVLVAELMPAAAFGFAEEPVARVVARLPLAMRVALPALLVVPYVVIAATQRIFRWQWFALYALLPVLMAWLLAQATVADPDQRGTWRDALILLTLGLAVDLRWLDVAWPAGLRGLNNLLLVDAGLYGFLAIRRLTGTGFDFHLHWSDWKTGLRELLFFAPAVLVLGLALGFLHAHSNVPAMGKAALEWAGIFVFVAVPEELFFRAWVQNLLERRVGRRAALVIASVLFAFRISTKGPHTSTGAMFCWPRLRESSTAAPGASAAVCPRLPLRTAAWIGCGRGGSRGSAPEIFRRNIGSVRKSDSISKLCRPPARTRRSFPAGSTVGSMGLTVIRRGTPLPRSIHRAAV